MNSKIKLLVITPNKTGVGYYRSINPHVYMDEKYSSEIEISIVESFDVKNPNFGKGFDLIHFHSNSNTDPNMLLDKIIQLKNNGVKLIMDLDDYWILPSYFPQYKMYNQQYKIHEKTIQLIKNVDYITTTTDIFANEISKHNKNVFVIPNAINPEEKQFKRNNIKTDRLRVGIICGSSHEKDIELLNGVVTQLKDDIDRLQFVICGFDLRGEIQYKDEKTGQVKSRPVRPDETVWTRYESVLTDKYSILSDSYKRYLSLYNENIEFPNVENQPYRRYWTKPVNQYATHYNNIDVLLVPLVENKFNECKCIVGDSLVSTDKGFLNISNIVNNEISLNTELNGIKNNVINYFKYENVNTIKVTTEDGYEIEGTPHHKIFINNNWVELKDLSEGDTIELTKPEFLQKEYKEITYPMLLTKNITEEKIKDSDEDMIPRIRINENWGRLLGYLLGDGNYNGKSSVSISCDKRHCEVVDDVINLYKSIGLNPLLCEKKIDKRCKKTLVKEGYGVDIKSTCVNFLSIAKKYGWCGSNGKTFRVPSVILESPKTVIREFLKGLFEADGTVGEHSSVELSSKDLKLIKQIQILLLGFEIQSTIRYNYNKRYRKYYYILDLRREGSEIFNKEIGFVSKHKKDKLQALINTKRSNNFKPQSMQNKIKTIENNINTVYDIEVENVHEYNANGIKNHNSQLKVIESGFFNKAIIAQNFGPYKIDLDSYIKKGGEINKEGNSLLVDSSKNHKMWAKHIKYLLNNPEDRIRMANNLSEKITKEYSLENVTKNRFELYKKMLNR